MAEPQPIGVSDAVRRHYLEALARRMETAPDPVRQILQEKLQRALAHHAERPALFSHASMAPPSCSRACLVGP